MPENKSATMTTRSSRKKPMGEPTSPIGDAIDILAEHITFEHGQGSKAKAEQLAAVRDQLSTLRARWGCR